MTYHSKILEDALGREEIFRKALFERPESLSALLPYDEILEEDNIFVMKDGSLGAMFSLSPLEHEALTSQEIISSVDGLRSWFALPDNCVLQVVYEQRAVSSLDPRWKQISSAYPDSHPVSKLLNEKRVAEMKDSCLRADGPLERTVFLAIRYFPEANKSKFGKELFEKSEKTLHRELKVTSRELQAFRSIAQNFQANSKIPLSRLNAQELLDFLRRFFNPKTFYKRSFAPANLNESLSQQILYHNPTLDHLGIEREGLKTRTLSLKTSPQYAYPGGMAYFTRLNFPFRLSMSFSFPTKNKVKQFFDLKEFFLQNTPSARARRQRDEVLEVQNRLAHDDRCLHLTFNVILEGESDEVLDDRTREFLNIFQNDLECEAIVESDIGLGLCLMSLPLNYSPRADYSTRRAIRILRSDATKFLPVFDTFRGLKNPLQLYESREKSPIYFSLLENETSNHTVVLADSGSGKSAFIIDCVQAAKRMNPEPLVFVVDKKSSYPMMAEYFDADMTRFERDKPIPFSPFRGVYDEEKIAFLTNLIVSAIQMTSPKFEVESDHRAAIAKSLKLAYIKKLHQRGLAYVEGELLTDADAGDVQLTMDDFVAELAALPSLPQYEKFGEITEKLNQKLTPFYSDGLYSRFFNAPTEPRGKKSKLFYIYDLDALDGDPILQALMTMAVFEEIRQTIRLPENRGRGGFIVVEELGMLGRDNPTASRFLVDFAETGRKLGYWLISLTPRPQNYFEMDVGKAMWSVADNFLFLQMSADNVSYVASHSSLLDEANQEIIKSLKTVRGDFAEVFYMNKKKSRQGAFRFRQTTLDRWLAPTNSKDTAAADKALKQAGGDKWKALEFLAATYPRGVV